MKYVILSLCILFTTSCQSLSLLDKPDAAYVAANEMFAAVVNTAADARDLGLLTEDLTKRIDANIQFGYITLAEWKAAMDSGSDTTSYAPLMKAIIRQINEYLNTEACNGPSKCSNAPRIDRSWNRRESKDLGLGQAREGWGINHRSGYCGGREVRAGRNEAMGIA